MLRYERKIMSIMNITKIEKVKVLLRLLDNNENIETACSKSGLNVSDVKKILEIV